MKLNKQFVTFNTDDEAMLVATGEAEFSGLVRGNPALGDLLNLLKEETTEQAVVAAMCAQYDAPEDVIAKDVHDALEQLRSIGAIME